MSQWRQIPSDRAWSSMPLCTTSLLNSGYIRAMAVDTNPTRPTFSVKSMDEKRASKPPRMQTGWEPQHISAKECG